MTSKTKALKKGTYKPGNATPAPAKKAEKKATTVASTNHIESDKKKEAEARSSTRRIRSMLKIGIEPKLIEEIFAQEDNRMVLVLLNGSYTVENGTKTVKSYKRDEKRHVKEVVTKEVPNILRGYEAAHKYIEDQKLHFVGGKRNALWVLTDKDNVDEVVKKLNILGRTSVTKPEKYTFETEQARIAKEKKNTKKPTNNTAEVKSKAKAARKQTNTKRAEMRPYYAALRKGGVSARIKRHNHTLAEKIEKWIKEKKATEASRKKGSKEERAKHRQLTSLEMKANKRARKVARQLATKERRIAAEKKRAESNAKQRAERAQKAQKPIQTELKMAA